MKFDKNKNERKKHPHGILDDVKMLDFGGVRITEEAFDIIFKDFKKHRDPACIQPFLQETQEGDE